MCKRGAGVTSQAWKTTTNAGALPAALAYFPITNFAIAANCMFDVPS